MDKMLKFPNNFLWGGATAAEQIEGKGITKKGKTIWDWMYEKDASLFWDNVGPQVTSDFTRNYKSDIKMWKEMGANSVRLGFSWARLFPQGMDKELNQEAVTMYHDIIDECLANGINPMMNIYHFDLPLWAAKKGGFPSMEVVEDYAQFARFIFKEYGSKLDYIVTMNEPQVPILLGYNADIFWPMHKNDNEGMAKAWFGTILAHAKAVKIFREEFSHLKTKIGCVYALSDPIAKDGVNFDAQDAQSAKDFGILFNHIWSSPMSKGEIPARIWELFKDFEINVDFEDEDLKIIEGTKADFIGINYYAPKRIQKPSKSIAERKKMPILTSLGEDYKWDKARYNVFRGWEIRPESLYEVAMYVKNELGNIPFYIGENGMGVEGEEQFRSPSNGEIQDDYRIAFLEEHLTYLHKSIEDGANCFGYHMWAMIDNWSWRNAYKNRYGFIEVNLDDQSRKYKKSAHWLKETSQNNGFINSDKKVEDYVDLNNIKYNKSVNYGDEE